MVDDFNMDAPIDPLDEYINSAADMNDALLRLHQAHQSAVTRLMQQTEADIQAEWQSAFSKLQPRYQALLTKYGADLNDLRASMADVNAETGEQIVAKLPLTWLTNNKAAADALSKAIQDGIDTFAADAADEVAGAQAVAAPAGAASALALVNQALSPVQNAGLAMQLIGHHPSEQALEQFIAHASNGAPLETLFNGFGAEAAAGARQALLTGLGLGQNPAAMASDIAQALQVSRDRAMTIARTETLNSYRDAALNTYQANSDVVQGWLWSSSQSANTCASCLFMDGSFHTLDEGMDTHVSCRCSMLPITSSWADILGPLGVDQAEIDAIGETSIADGAYRAGDYGAAWFARQGEAFQRDVLGPAKFAAYSKGDITLGDLVGVHHDPVWGDAIYEKSLKELGLNARDYLTVFGALPGRETTGEMGRQLAEFQAVQAQALVRAEAKAAAISEALARTGYRGPTAAYVREVEQALVPRIEQYAALHPEMTLDEYRAAVQERLQSLLSGDIQASVRVPSDVLDQILNDGRLKTSNELNDLLARGESYQTTRQTFERGAFGYTKDTPLDRLPISGYITQAGQDSGAAQWYGDARLVLTPEALDRATASFGDSLDGDLIPRPVSDMKWDAYNFKALTERDLASMDEGARAIYEANLAKLDPLTWDSIKAYGAKNDLPNVQIDMYLEAQIHGGVGVRDIEQIIFTGEKPDAALLQRLDDAGIKWSHEPQPNYLETLGMTPEVSALTDAAQAAAEAAARGDKAAFDWEAEHVAGLARAYGVEPPPLFGRGTGGATGTWEQWYREQIEPLLPASERGLFGAASEHAELTELAAQDIKPAAEGIAHVGSAEVGASVDALRDETERMASIFDVESAGESEEASKARISHDLASALADNPAWQRLIPILGAEDGEAAASRLLKQWALGVGSVHDENRALYTAIHLAVREEFGLDATVRSPEADLALAERYFGANMDGLRAYVREMYDQTQAKFADEGITDVALYRGRGWDAGLGLEPHGFAWDDVAHEGTFLLQPAASFSTNAIEAYNFGGGGDIYRERYQMFMATRLDARNILSTALTGFGSKEEAEMVALGRPVDGLVWSGHVEVGGTPFMNGGRVYQEVANASADLTTTGERGLLEAAAASEETAATTAVTTAAETAAETAATESTVTYTSDAARERLMSAFDQPLTDAQVANLAGAPDGATVTVDRYGMLNVTAPDGSTSTVYLALAEPGEAGPTLMNWDVAAPDGSRISVDAEALARQVREANALGVDSIHMKVRPLSDDGLRLPELGYNAPLGATLPETLAKSLPAEFRDTPMVLDLLARPGGREWWAENVMNPGLDFDPHPGSQSWLTLDAYLREHGLPGLDAAFSEARALSPYMNTVQASYDLAAEDQAFAAQLREQVNQLDQATLTHTDALDIGGQLHDRITSDAEMATYQDYAQQFADMRAKGPDFFTPDEVAWVRNDPDAIAAHGGVKFLDATARVQAEYQARVAAYLSEVRDLGGDLNVAARTGSTVADRVFDDIARAQSNLPSDWIAASNDLGQLRINSIGRAATYGGYYQGFYNGNGAIALYTDMVRDVEVQSTFTHEFMHRMEDVLPQLGRLEADFYNARTAGDALVDLTNGIQMQTKLDQWVDEYLGRVPFPTPLGGQSYELLSIGAEAALGGGVSYDMAALREDKEFMSFILGLLAIVRADGGLP